MTSSLFDAFGLLRGPRPAAERSAAGLGLFVVLAASCWAASSAWCPPPGARLTGPSRLHPLGTDPAGYDVLWLLLRGAVVSFYVAGLASACSATVAVALTLGSTSSERAFKLAASLTSAFASLPRIPLVVASILVLPPSPTSVALVFALLSWPHVAQAILPRARQVCREKYVEAARSFGAGWAWVASRYVFPSILPTWIASTSITAAHAIVAEAGLSLLGLGDPTSPSWGRVAFNALTCPGALYTLPGLIQLTAPMALIVATSYSLYLVGSRLAREPEGGPQGSGQSWWRDSGGG